MVHHVMPIDSGGTYVHAGLSLQLSRVSGNYASCQMRRLTRIAVEHSERERKREKECNIANSNIFCALNVFAPRHRYMCIDMCP